MLLLRSSIFKYKKFFQKKLQNFRSLFCLGYQKLPKTPLHNHSVAAAVDSNPSYKDLDKLYNEFTKQWDSEKGNTRTRTKKKVVISSPPTTKQEKEVQMEKREECEDQKDKKSITHHREYQRDSSFNGNRNCLVKKKLRELEMLDKSDVDYILDIEEVLHYYSRLTCPSYLEIVDKFFMEMYSEFFGVKSTLA